MVGAIGFGGLGRGSVGSKVRPKRRVRVRSKIGVGKSRKIGAKSCESIIESVNLGSVYGSWK